jgi:sigma-B regulation protein RsbU (phosphoserine phosphatase)
MFMKGLSLRYKLLAALTVIPIVGLSLFLLLAVNIFEKDKIAYIFESSLSVSKTRAARVGSGIENFVGGAQSVVLGYRADTKDLSETALELYDKDTKLKGFRVFALGGARTYEPTVTLEKEPAKGLFEANSRVMRDIVKRMARQPIGIGLTDDGRFLMVVARFGALDDPKHVMAVSLFNAAEIGEMFQQKSAGVNFLMRKDGSTLFASADGVEAGWEPPDIWSALAATAPEGIAEIVAPSKSHYLVSYAETGMGDLVVLSLVERHVALKAIDVLIRKSVLFFIAVLSMTAIIAVIASRGLTGALTRLSEATHKIAGGDFGVRVDVKGGGEIGLLAHSFNVMAEEVSRLMKETAEKARMESELATARTVQETLFPDATAQMESVTVSGRYMPASECGGDWWYYCENEDKVYIWIGDATGHGAPAALITSAARAVASVIQAGPPIPVSTALTLLNRAICDTSKGKMMMTFFLAAIDKHTGEMSYANASHEPPLLVHHKADGLGRDDFEPLQGVNNPRLGERRDCEFEEITIRLEPGDRVIFYTDGLVDVRNGEQKNYGERRFLKALAAEASEHESNEPVIDGVMRSLEEFRGAEPLPDDVTLVMCSYKGAA